MNEPLTQLHAEAMTAEREWTVEEIPVLSASISSSNLKLVSALIVAIAIASPTLRQLVGFQKLKWKRKAQYGGKTETAAVGTEKEEK